MSITRFAIEKNRITVTALVIVIAAGVWTFFSLPRAEDPGFVVRTALVTTIFPGASPERIEQLVTDKLEKAIQEIPELKTVRSESKTGASIVFVDIEEQYTEMRPIWDDLRRKVDAARAELPDGVIGPIVNDDFGDVFGTIMTVTGDGFSYAELKNIADEVRDELLRIPEVAKVDIYGAQEERVFVEYNNARLSEVGLSPVILQQMLESRNIIIPGGYVNTGVERIALEPSGDFGSVEELRRTVINLPGSSEVVYLEDIVNIRRGYVDPPQTIVTASGTSALALAISMRDGGNILTLGEEFQQVYTRLRSIYPWGVDFDVLAFQPDVVRRSVNGFVSNVLQAVAIVIVVMLITLGPRTGLIAASLIPLTILMTFLVMGLLNIGLNQMSLAALIIALGLLVDNSIVMSESIMVQLAAGKSRLEAMLDSAAELRIPLLVSSLTTAAAFLPIYLAESSAGEFTSPIFTVVAITLLSSWLLAITAIPLLSFYFMRVKAEPTGEHFDTRFYRTYRRGLLFALRHRGLSVFGIVGIFAGALWAFRFVPNIFFPASPNAVLTAEITLPSGTQIERTEEVTAAVERFVAEELSVSGDRAQGVINWASFVGEGAPRYVLTYSPEPPKPAYAFVLMNVTSRDYVDVLIPQLERFTAMNIPGATAKFSPAILGPPVTAPIEVRVSGRDEDVLFSLVDSVKTYLATLDGTRNVVDDWGRRTKKLMVRVNQPRALRAGVSSRGCGGQPSDGSFGLRDHPIPGGRRHNTGHAAFRSRGP